MWKRVINCLSIFCPIFFIGCVNSSDVEKEFFHKNCNPDKIVITNYIKLLGVGNKEPYVDYIFNIAPNPKLQCYMVGENERIPLKLIEKSNVVIYRFDKGLLFKSLSEIDSLQNSKSILLYDEKDSCIINLKARKISKKYYLDDKMVESNNYKKMSAHIDINKYVDDFVGK